MSRTRDLRTDDRGASVTVNYVLNLAVAAMIIAGVLTATGGMVEDRRETAARTELSVVGERIAADLMAADRLATVGSGPNETVSLSLSLPERVAATRYEVSVEAAPSNSKVVLRTENPDVTVTVGFHNATAVGNATVRGGDLRIALNTDSDELEVAAA